MDTEQEYVARAFRGDRLLCGRVVISVRFHDHDRRLGLTRRERRILRARFDGELAPELRGALAIVAGCRGAAAQRAAERIEPLTLVMEDPREGRIAVKAGVMPPDLPARGAVRDLAFGLHEIGDAQRATPTRLVLH